MLQSPIERGAPAGRSRFDVLLRTVGAVLLPACVLVAGTGCVDAAADRPAVAADDRPAWTPAEADVRATIERFLAVAGNWDLDAMKALFAEHANLAIVSVRNGAWTAQTMTIDRFFEEGEERALGPYYEPVGESVIRMTEDRIAFVRADAVLHSFGVPRSRNVNHFTLIRHGDAWRIINVSFTGQPFAPGERSYDLETFARGYGQAWSGVRPEFVAMHFAEDGSLRVNDGVPAVGRRAITDVVRGFMTDLPDRVVTMDSLRSRGDAVEFHWTLTGTNTGPGGTGRSIRISGYEEWTLNEAGLIAASKGHFDADAYRRQLEHGADGT